MSIFRKRCYAHGNAKLTPYHLDGAAQRMLMQDGQRLQEDEHIAAGVGPTTDQQPHPHLPAAGDVSQGRIYGRPESAGMARMQTTTTCLWVELEHRNNGQRQRLSRPQRKCYLRGNRG